MSGSRMLVVLLAGAAVVASVGFAPAPAADQIAYTVAVPDHRHITPAPLRFAVVGDSITAGCTGHMEHVPDACTWAYAAAAPLGLRYAGGWAQAGATSTLMADSAYPVDADVLVVMAGTNNFHNGIGAEQHVADLERIAATIGAPRVVVLALPPIDYIANMGNPIVAERNVILADAAAQRGWDFIDPWAGFRTENNTWVFGASGDGIHPTSDVEAVAGSIIAAHLQSTNRTIGGEDV